MGVALAIAVLAGMAAVSATGTIRSHVTSPAPVVAASAPLDLSIPASSMVTAAPNVIGLENLAARAVSQHKSVIVVSGNVAASAGAASRRDVTVTILRSVLAALHSNIVVTTTNAGGPANVVTVSA